MHAALRLTASWSTPRARPARLRAVRSVAWTPRPTTTSWRTASPEKRDRPDTEGAVGQRPAAGSLPGGEPGVRFEREPDGGPDALPARAGAGIESREYKVEVA